jgi:hypothetical protein
VYLYSTSRAQLLLTGAIAVPMPALAWARPPGGASLACMGTTAREGHCWLPWSRAPGRGAAVQHHIRNSIQAATLITTILQGDAGLLGSTMSSNAIVMPTRASLMDGEDREEEVARRMVDASSPPVRLPSGGRANGARWWLPSAQTPAPKHREEIGRGKKRPFT